MVNIKYSSGSTDLNSAEVQNNGGASTDEQAKAMFNNLFWSNDVIGFETSTVGTISSRPKLTYNHPRQSGYNTGGWNLTNGIQMIFKEDDDGFYGGSFTLYLNNTSTNFIQKYIDEDGVEQTTSSHAAQAAKIQIIPTDTVDEIRRITIEFYAKRRDKIQVVCFVAGGEIIDFEDVLSASLIEEMNILSDDLPINEFDFSVVCSQELGTGQKLYVYSNDVYYGTFYTEEVNKTSQSLDGTKKVYTLECVNAIGLLDKIVFDDCTITFLNGACSGETTLSTELSNKAGISLDIERATSTTNYGLVGLVPVQSLRYYLCQFAWSICRWVCTARRDDILLKSIPTAITRGKLNRNEIITADYIIGNSIYTKEKIITSATWEHIMPALNWSSQGAAVTKTNLPAGTKKKVYYDNPPAWIDINDNSKFSYAEWKANYFIYSSSAQRNNVEVYTIPNTKQIENIVGKTADTQNEIAFNKFDSIGIINFDIHTYKEYLIHGGYDPSESDYDFYYQLYNKGTWNEITASNLIYYAKINDIKKYIKSTGKVTATVILKDNLENLKVGDMVQIDTAFDGRITGIVTKMDISFGYNNTAKVEIRESGAFIA